MDCKDIYRVVGLMSGTSLDGLDLVLCEFERLKSGWDFNMYDGKTVRYDEQMKRELSNAQDLSAYHFVELHKRFGAFMGQEVAKFVSGVSGIDFVASHGHTVFHEPDKNVTFQIGCGAHIAAECGLNVVSDFRTLDIALGGQGAPLVPIGDKLLFGQYGACVNLGGFANISFDKKDKRIAFDICPLNIVLNDMVSRKYGLTFDVGGKIGAQGHVVDKLLKELNQLDYYQLSEPKSLAREWVERFLTPLFNEYESIDARDMLATCYWHFAKQIANVLNENRIESALFTGGGTFNTHLMNLIEDLSDAKIVIPRKEVIDFKEALIFAFLGVLRMERQVNCLSSVTGASVDNIGGNVFCR
ncbi:anhydro-N-acetylmuramic acid kinase [Saccharicrinis fermentans]|uniref:Anhydro-N-acetylmuramic acid kinase n=1 Tax=Saccharicrinis fermentans DSM 9555 = JCM 21142 TaxID=869213 RepID=W7Y9Z2_9BACT|nr:anhydro-N-acetylmuramic acid kinase [Saccharicrinis fermentans]GAF04363.1 anhydro-N-acetylmuramic acid kinase [Saccharicrinis fermentans DSM 9555 = JCM 21142]